MQAQTIVIILLCLFILYRIFLRIRRAVGWQPLNPGKMQFFTVLFSILGLLFLVEGVSHPASLISDAAGLLLGVILAYCGAATTRFEQRGGRWHYRPNMWIGGTVTVLFLGRLIYRIYDMYSVSQAGGFQGGAAMTGSLQSMVTGWSAGLMLVMFVYYTVYNVFLLRKKEQLSHSGSR